MHGEWTAGSNETLSIQVGRNEPIAMGSSSENAAKYSTGWSKPHRYNHGKKIRFVIIQQAASLSTIPITCEDL